ncbi:MAG: MFS transporter, partial [Chitinophagales bacterium]
ALAILVSTGLVRYWHVVLLALGLGLVNAFDMPVRQAYVVELVGGRDDLMNAIALNSSIFNAARIVGPALAGLVMGTWGAGAAFYLNAVSFLAVIWGLWLIPAQPPAAARGDNRLLAHLKEGLAYVARERAVAGPLLLLGILSAFAMNFNVLVPVYARSVLHESARGYGFLMSALGMGALVGSLSLAGRARRGPDQRLLLLAGAGLGLFQLLLAGVKGYVLAAAVLALMGWAMITFVNSVNSTIQLSVPDELRGRVVSLYALLLNGVSPIGAVFAGGLAGRCGAPVSIAAAGVIGVAASGAALVAYLRDPRREQGPAAR